MIGAEPYERTPARSNERNGHRDRLLSPKAGDVELRIPNVDKARTLLWVVWLGALGGVLFRVFWVGAPRWLYTPIYCALGWVAVIYLPDFYRSGGVALLTLIIVGGALYTVGAVVYGLKRPNPSPRWFGFHEIFHACTIAAFTVHYIAVSIAVYTHT